MERYARLKDGTAECYSGLLGATRHPNATFFSALSLILALWRLSTSSATSVSGLSGRFDVAPMTKLNPLLIAARDGCRERLQGLLQP